MMNEETSGNTSCPVAQQPPLSAFSTFRRLGLCSASAFCDLLTVLVVANMPPQVKSKAQKAAAAQAGSKAG